MKINWGHKIFLLYMSFVIMISVLVYKCTRVHFDLVSDDYYDKEVKYQGTINSMKNTLSLTEKPKSAYNKSNGSVEINFPESFLSDGIKGKIDFFKPDNASLDFSSEINLKGNNIQKIDSKKLAHGAWKIKTSWIMNNTSYYQEENIFVN